MTPIPARAGEPSASSASCRCDWAYPRAGGGTAVNRCRAIHSRGLSPRGRGNRKPRDVRGGVGGPIPARAGEPLTRSIGRWVTRAYPRAGGGTIGRMGLPVEITGLSPRGRGNRGDTAGGVGPAGPIPARAGEPGCRSGRCALAGAYPRAGGGTSSTSSAPRQYMGLSPRRRGNH